MENYSKKNQKMFKKGPFIMSLKKIEKIFNSWGKKNALYTVLVGNENWNIRDFMKTGEEDINNLINDIEKYNITKEKALDFGCGVGRLTIPLSNYFGEVYGVDIAESMVKKAKENDTEGKCKLLVNTKRDLSIFPDNHFDLIYSNITLQHMPIKYSKNYIREFIRIVKPDGIVVFFMPDHRANRNILKIIKSKIKRILKQLFIEKKWNVYYFRKNKLIKFLNKSGADVIDIKLKPHGGPGVIGYNYYFKKDSKLIKQVNL
jgi:ubiquinone/menaquinone biosynthesis C-methylase UbiE